MSLRSFWPASFVESQSFAMVPLLLSADYRGGDRAEGVCGVRGPAAGDETAAGSPLQRP